MRLRQKLAAAVVAFIVILVVMLLATRFLDGPYGMLSGGAFTSGKAQSG